MIDILAFIFPFCKKFKRIPDGEYKITAMDETSFTIEPHEKTNS
jgi:hypothetical protein